MMDNFEVRHPRCVSQNHKIKNFVMVDNLGFDFWKGQGICVFSKTYRPALGPVQPPLQWVWQFLSSWVNWLGLEADHLSPYHLSSVEMKNEWIYTSSPLIRLCGMHSGRFTCTAFVLFPVNLILFLCIFTLFRSYVISIFYNLNIFNVW